MKYEISVGGFDDRKLVGFNLNGIDVWNEKLTVYDTATGIIPEYRGKGITYKSKRDAIRVCINRTARD